MALTHTTAARNANVDAVLALLNTGGAGSLVLEDASNVEVATIGFSATAFASAASGQATANSTTDDSSATGGTTTQFKAVDGAGTTVFTGTVGTSGTDVVLSNNVIPAGSTVQILGSNITYTAGA